MESWHWAIALRPFVTAALLLITGVLIVYPLRRFLPEGRVKRALLWRTTRAKGWQNLIPITLVFGLWFYLLWLGWSVY